MTGPIIRAPNLNGWKIGIRMLGVVNKCRLAEHAFMLFA